MVLERQWSKLIYVADRLVFFMNDRCGSKPEEQTNWLDVSQLVVSTPLTVQCCTRRFGEAR